MILFIIFLLIILFGHADLAKPNSFNQEYMSRNNTNIIKGLFVIIILLGHGSTYVSLGGAWDEPYMALKQHLNQMVVAMFFFYSGFGMMKSILAKRFQYIKGMPVKRFLTVFLNFDIAVVLFLIMNFFLDKTFDLKTIALSLIGWSSVGNSNWYMFDIFVLYILMFVAFYLLRWFDRPIANYIATIVFTVLAILFVLWEIRMGQPNWCYNTIILMPLGCWYALLQKPIERIMFHNDYIYTIICAIVGGVYWVSYQNRWSGGIELYTVWAVLFTLMIVCITMKVTFKSKLLVWFGEHVFSMYILQRIPMTILSKQGIAAQDKYMFMILTILFTICIALIFDFFVGKLDKFIVGALSSSSKKAIYTK